ncbi:MAG: serine/threonine protein kinase, partial [Planctomycetes bacterium]|nr:serine/threonine protein kinase [Planctomycetota bacterium]
HFLLEEFIGGGGMGVVFRATDTTLGRTVAVKVVASHEMTEDALRRFRNEAQSAARLDHPNVARVYFVGEDKGWNFIVFEYIEGVNVRDLVVRNGPLSVTDTIKITLQICDALEHASQRDVIHRDIKPSNILIMADGRAKLVDMGLARLRQVESAGEDLTESGVTLGTFDYISPEQARDPRNTDVRSDLYSLGCTVFFMLTGQPPFPNGTVLQKLLSHSSDAPPDPRENRPDLPEDLIGIVLKLLAKSPGQRHQTPRLLSSDLILLADRLGLTDVRAHANVWIAPTEQRPSLLRQHLPWVVPVAALVLIAMATQWWDSRSHSSSFPTPNLIGNAQPAVRTSDNHSPDQQRTGELAQPRDTKTAPGPAAPPGGSSDEGKPAVQDKPASDQESAADPGATGGAAAVANDQGSVPSPAPETERTNGKPGNGRPKPDASNGQTDPPSGASVPGTGPGNAAAVPASAAPLNHRVLIVADQEVTDWQGNAIVVSSLREAIEQAMILNQVDEIHLHFNGIRYSPPIDCDLTALAGRTLTIRAADGCAPIVAFRAATEDTARMPRTAMIRVRGGHLNWLDTDFFLDLPPGIGENLRASLFQLDAIDRIEFRRCSFSIHDADRANPTSPRSLAFLEFVGTSPVTAFSAQGDALPVYMPTVWLEQCIARGPATFIRSERAGPFLLSWEHGLFASTERLVEVGGTTVEPRWEHGRVTLFFRRLLSAADQGICLLTTGPTAPYPLGLAANCYDCLFATAVSEAGVPLYRLRGGVPSSDETNLIDIGGNNNYYKNTTVVLRVEPDADADPNGAVRQYAFDQVQSPEDAPWFHEKSPQPATIFAWPQPVKTIDGQTWLDFVPPGLGDGPFTRILGIAPSLFRPLPDFSAEFSDAATSPTPPPATNAPTKQPGATGN